MNFIVGSLLNQLQRKNPQNYNFVSEMMRNNGNPDAFIKQIFSKASPEQKQAILNQAKNYGCPNEVLSHIQNLR
jgi:hypothetical protein